MLTAIVTSCNYARYLPRCLESALEFCDEVLVYDDGSTDDTLGICSRYPVKVTHRDDATGDPVWGSNLGIKHATGDHLIFLDADNYLIAPPPVTDADYTFAPIRIVDDSERALTLWEYPTWPLTAWECWAKFVASCNAGSAADVMRTAGTPGMPFPWGGVWRTEFIKPLRWRPWKTTAFAADFRTALDWCKRNPTLAYVPEPFLAFRKHDGQWSESPEREVMRAEARLIAKTEKGPRVPAIPADATIKEAGMLYTSPTRVIRRGILIAFAGEQMTRPEAMARGLITEAAPEPEQERAAEPPKKRRPAKH
jgi:hypothetical protein